MSLTLKMSDDEVTVALEETSSDFSSALKRLKERLDAIEPVMSGLDKAVGLGYQPTEEEIQRINAALKETEQSRKKSGKG